MDLFAKIAGTIKTFFHIGVDGPKIKNVSGAVELKNFEDTAFVTLRAAAPVGLNDVAVKEYVDSVSGSTSTFNVKTGSSVSARDVVYITAGDEVDKADADAAASMPGFGFALTSESGGDPVEIQFAGILAGFSGLTPGARYFVSGTAGGITITPVSGDGKIIQVIGFAKSATELLIKPGHVIRRAE